MKPDVRQALNAINRRFYDERAGAFASKRARPWKGFDRVLRELTPGATVLDVGCGHGRFARAVADSGVADLEYLGLDSSPAMLALAQAQGLPGWVQFRLADVVETPITDAVASASYSLVTLFGVLHHVPGGTTRDALLRTAVACLRPGGILAVSLWRFDRSHRFARHCIDPSVGLKRCPGLQPADLEPGDHLLDFDGQSDPPRYCHFPTTEEVASLLALPGTSLHAHYTPATGDRLNEYLLLRRLPRPEKAPPGEPSAAC